MKKTQEFFCLVLFMTILIFSFTSSAWADDIVITKNPTDEETDSSGYVIFIAKAENYHQIVWHLVSPDGVTDYGDKEILQAFPELTTDGFGSEKLKLSNVTEALHGWKVKAEFIGDQSMVFTDEALITIKGYHPPEEAMAEEKSPQSKSLPEAPQEAAPEVPSNAAPEEETAETEFEASSGAPASVTQPLPEGIGASPAVEFDITDAGNVSGGDVIVRNVTVVALWNEATLGVKPEMLYEKLYRNGNLYMTAALSADNNWSYTFTYLSNGHYELVEDPETDYVIAYGTSGNTITVMHNYIGMPVQAENLSNLEQSEEYTQQQNEPDIITASRGKLREISDFIRNIPDRIPRDRKSIIVSAASGILVIAAVLCISMLSHRNRD